MAIAAGGGIPSLVQLLRSGSSEAKSNAAAALWNLAVNAENQLKMGQSGAVPLLADMLTATAGAQDGKAHAAGGLLFRCSECPKAFCEDPLPLIN